MDARNARIAVSVSKNPTKKKLVSSHISFFVVLSLHSVFFLLFAVPNTDLFLSLIMFCLLNTIYLWIGTGMILFII